MPALGFKLSGVEGKLEIGIQGVVRFIAQEVALLTAGDLPPNQGLTAALALAGAFVEVLGKAVPEKKNVTLMVVFAEGGPAGWLVGGSPEYVAWRKRYEAEGTEEVLPAHEDDDAVNVFGEDAHRA